MKFIVEGISTLKEKEKVRPCDTSNVWQGEVNEPVDTDPNYINPDAYVLLGNTFAKRINTEDIVEFIKTIVCHEMRVTWEELIAKNRKRELVYGRHLFSYFMKKYTKLPLSSIGRMINGRDHATILHSNKAWNNLCDTDRDTYQMTAKLSGQINDFLSNREDFRNNRTSGDVIADWNKVKYKYINYKDE